MEPEKAAHRVPIRDLVRYYLRLGLVGFGGPAALVGQMERERVAERKWLQCRSKVNHASRRIHEFDGDRGPCSCGRG